MISDLLKEWAIIAPGFTSALALIAVIVAWRQFRLNRHNQRETTAKGIFREYLKLAFDNPDLASGKTGTMTKERLEKYAWFVAYMLWTTEEVLEFAKNDPVWSANMRGHLVPHKEFFRADQEFLSDLPSYSPEVQNLVRLVTQSG